MKKILTGDGSYTFLNEQVGEVYHSVSGAEEEAIKKYAEPTNLAELAKSGEVAILDICFGIGYNSAAAIDRVLEANPKCKIKIIGLELDKSLFEKLQELEPKFNNYNIIRQLENGKFNNGQIDIHLIYGDAKQTIKQVQKMGVKFDVCFFDPFSPSKVPDMWTENFFTDIASCLKDNAILSTYSCATHVRINLVRSGFDVKDGPIVGRRSPSTIAIKLP